LRAGVYRPRKRGCQPACGAWVNRAKRVKPAGKPALVQTAQAQLVFLQGQDGLVIGEKTKQYDGDN
jgi:hypothetical protein